MHQCLRQSLLALRRPGQWRAYATQVGDKSLPTPELARTLSTPLAVRARRAKRFGPLATRTSDAAPSGLSPSDKIKYRRLRALDRLPRNAKGHVFSEHEFRDYINSRRSRLRGLRLSPSADAETPATREVIGKPVFLPNVIFRLIRNYTPPGEAYNPYEATFRVPKNITKTDIRAYLYAVYGLEITYVRTAVYNTGSLLHAKRGAKNSEAALSNYKRAVVGLKDPFYYPLRVEDMPVEDREEYLVWLEENYSVQEARARSKHSMKASKARMVADPNFKYLTEGNFGEVPTTPGMEAVARMKENILNRRKALKRAAKKVRVKARKLARAKKDVALPEDGGSSSSAGGSRSGRDMTLGDL